MLQKLKNLFTKKKEPVVEPAPVKKKKKKPVKRKGKLAMERKAKK